MFIIKETTSLFSFVKNICFALKLDLIYLNYSLQINVDTILFYPLAPSILLDVVNHHAVITIYIILPNYL